MKTMKRVLLLTLLVAVPGCMTPEEQATEGMSRVRVGMSSKEVVNAVGLPALKEVTNGGTSVWTYQYSGNRSEVRNSDLEPPPDRGVLEDRAAFTVVFDRESHTVIRVARVAP